MTLRKSAVQNIFLVFLLGLLLVQESAAQVAATISGVVCPVIAGIYRPLTMIGASLVLLMIVYAGLKYVYSADDPGGRKQAKSMIVNAIIGGVIIVIAWALWSLVFTGSGINLCPGM